MPIEVFLFGTYDVTSTVTMIFLASLQQLRRCQSSGNKGETQQISTRNDAELPSRNVTSEGSSLLATS